MRAQSSLVCLAVNLALIAMKTMGASLAGTYDTVPQGSAVDLTAEGKSDWIHWGLYTVTSLDRKAGVPALINDFELLGDTNAFLTVYQFSDNANGYTWTDGDPTSGVTNSPTGVWAYCTAPLESGFEISAPADMTTRTLKLYVGAFNARGQLRAFLSDGSAPGYTNSSLQNIGNGPSAVYTLTYAADSAGQTLRVEWVLVQPFGQTPNVTLQAAALYLTNGGNPPLGSITSPTNNAAYEAPAIIPLAANVVRMEDDVARVEFYSDAELLGTATQSPYSINWSNVSAGRYLLRAVAVDTNNVSGTSAPVEIFVYGTGGSLTGHVALPPGAVNLTEEGTNDWVHWGLVVSNSLDRKVVSSPQISGATILGTSAPERFADNLTAFSWSDGIPTASVSGTPTGIFVTGNGHGFQLTASADGDLRRLRIYVGGYGAQGNFQAYLSDFSAPPYTDNSISNYFGNSYAVYTLDYTAATPGQTLHLVYRTLKLFDFDFGNVTLAAVALQGGAAAPPQSVLLVNPELHGTEFQFSFATQPAIQYQVVFTSSLNPTNWQTLTNVTGSGQVVTVTNDISSGDERYYRVLAQ